MGGSLGALVRIRADGRAGDFFKVGGILTDLHLEIPLGAQSQRVRIEKASIRRIEKPPDAAPPPVRPAIPGNRTGPEKSPCEGGLRPATDLFKKSQALMANGLWVIADSL